MFTCLRDFINALDAAGELARIKGPVSPILEVTALADRESKLRCAGLPAAATRAIDPRFHDRGGRALYFENIEGSPFPLVINAWGSYRRVEMALGCHEDGHTPGGFEALAARIGSLAKPQPPSSLPELIEKGRELLPLLSIPPRRRAGRGPCQEVILTGDRIDLTALPILRCWPLDGDLASVGYPADVNDHVPGLSRGEAWDRNFRGRYITLAGIHTIHADDEHAQRPASHNIGMYRVQIFGKRHAAMHWHMHHDGARHWRSWKKRGCAMPVAIVLGGESVLPYAATAPLPPGISELLLAGFLNRGGIPMVRAATVPLWVPANAEIVIEGWVSDQAGMPGWEPRAAGEGKDKYGLGPGAVFEGPFGDHTGFYSMPDRYPLLEVSAITHRKDAVYPTTVVGLPPQEDYFLGKATERLFLPLLRTIVHDIEDYDLPLFGAFHNCACIRVKKAYPTQARRVMHSVWGAGQMAWTKTVFVVDDDVDVHDVFAVLSAAALRCDPVRDIESVNGPLDILDHAAPRLGVGRKIGFDCTRKIAGEDLDGRPLRGDRPAPSEADISALLSAVTATPGVRAADLPGAAAHGWLFISCKKPEVASLTLLRDRIAAAIAGLAWKPPFIILIGEAADPRDTDMALFHWAANADASRDLTIAHGCAIFDATPKRQEEGTAQHPVRAWPPIISLDHAVTARALERAAPPR